jgi:four helix bundle protein
MAPYERLAAWRHCHRLALEIYRVTAAFPSEERYGLVSQARRAAFSAAANIVEGSAKRGRAEFRRFLDISLGSLAELSYLLRLASDLGMLPEPELPPLQRLHAEASKTTWGLYRSLSPQPPNRLTA